ESDLNVSYAEVLPELEIGQIHDALVEGEGEYTVGADGGLQQIQTLRTVKLTGEEVRERTVQENDTFEQMAERVGEEIVSLEEKVAGDFTPEEKEVIWAL